MNALEKAQELFNELENLRPLSTEYEQQVMQKLRLDWNYHSSHLEGNQLTRHETKAFFLFGQTANTSKPYKNYVEMEGHNKAIGWIISTIEEKDERPFSEGFICELHELLLREPYEVDAVTLDGESTKKIIRVGEYKSTPNHIERQPGENFYFASTEETPSQMHDLVSWFRTEKEKNDANIILLAAEFHYRFIRIHPFDDGNGRMARLLMNFILMSYDYPPVIIKTEDKENYFSVLRLVDNDKDKQEYLTNYIAENVCNSLETMIRAAKGEEIEESDDLDKEVFLLKQKVNSLGETTKEPKNLNDIKSLYKESIVPLYLHYKRRMANFNQLYSASQLRLSLQGGSKILKVDSLEELRTKINNWTFGVEDEIWLTYQFKGPIKQLYKFNYDSWISIKLTAFQVIIEDTTSHAVELNYGEILSEDQIELVVKNEMRKHKKRLEDFIKDTLREE